MRSLWTETKLPEFPELNGEVHTDVLIIGGGIAGILAAWFLHQNGVKYVLAEKNRICSGITANTTAKITLQHGLIYHKLMKSAGREAAQKYFKANRLAAKKFESMCREINCGYEKRDSYVYSRKDRAMLEEEMEALRAIGCEAELISELPLLFWTAGGVRIPGQAQFHPLQFLAEIAKDLNIYEHTFVREMIGTTAVTGKGKIYARRVVVATHFPFLNKRGSYFLKLYQHRSYELALKTGAGEDKGIGDGIYVDEAHTGMSFRYYQDYLILGGGGHRTGKKGGGFEELRKFAKKHYPGAKECFAWGAQDCMSLDGIPYIGHYSKNTPDFFVASGFNKWGMTGSMAAAMLLSEELMGRRPDYADVFDPSRSMLKPQLLINGAEAMFHLLAPAKKRCPHLGCGLKWNAAEHSWDCPCHGSRFSEDGKVLDNPSHGE